MDPKIVYRVSVKWERPTRKSMVVLTLYRSGHARKKGLVAQHTILKQKPRE